MVALALLAVLLFFILRRRSRHSATHSVDNIAAELSISKYSEDSSQAPIELDATETAKAELPAVEPASELLTPVAELESPVSATWNSSAIFAVTPLSHTAYASPTDEKSAAEHAIYDTGTTINGPPPYPGPTTPTHVQRELSSERATPIAAASRRRFSWESNPAG